MKKTLLLISSLLLTACTTAPEELSPPEEIVSSEQIVEIGLVKLEDNGQNGTLIGCGDSLVMEERTVNALNDEELVEETLNELFIAQSTGLYNVFDQSSLTVDSIEIDNLEVKATLSGTPSLSGVCDNPRFKEQLEQTLAQFAPTVEVVLNNQPLADALSLQ